MGDEERDDIRRAAAEFGPFDGRLWFNTAHQGPLPRAAVVATERAGALKAAPHRIGDDDFHEVPEQLRSLLARLVGGSSEQIVLGNSTSHGLHLVANGLPWAQGDEVLVIEGDYPATILPWQRLAPSGVGVRSLRPAHELLSAGELTEAISPRTRLLAVTWVDSFTGRALDLHALGAVCREAGVLLVVNASQALGARPIDVASTPVDAVVSCGYKWLCGPYGTGFTWLHPDLLDRLEPQQAYWLAMQAGRGLDQMRETTVRDDPGVRAFDVFCPANFATTLPWIASLELFLDTGIDRVAAWDQHLVDRLVDGVDPGQYQLISPASGPTRSTLVVVSRFDGTTEARQRQLTTAGIDTAFREGNLRLSVHLFNTAEQVDQAVTALHAPTTT
ncbi:MAG TPA: aminotransferase class V-fold PLP-dependent enzyme [Streptosporangiaceae bacterium]|jgi:selenocysteine lyase/cysteine desulfurase|nr:aminotransferase class V-fold PLP-dependent enzyme [Streptosporangiaceae bacterium]